MAEHVRGTYLLLCGKSAKDAAEALERAYSDFKDESGVPYAAGIFYRYFNFDRLFDKIKMANIVQKEILDPYNVYYPIMPVENFVDSIDFDDSDFTWIKDEK
jgi:hypothetical protein